MMYGVFYSDKMVNIRERRVVSIPGTFQPPHLIQLLMHFLFGKIGFLPKSSPALDHIPKVGCTLVKYPLGT
jgi:hypothetical protein